MPLPQIIGFGTFYETQDAGTPNMPAHQAGDDLYLIINCGNVETVALTANPSGFTLVPGTGVGTGGTGGVNGECRLTIYHKRAVDGSTTAPTLFNPGVYVAAVIMVVRGGAEDGNPWEEVLQNTVTPASTTITVAGGTSDENECLIVGICGHGRDTAGALVTGTANATLANVAEAFDNSTSLGHGGGIAVLSGEKASAGVFGAFTATLPAASLQDNITLILRGTPAVPDPWNMNSALVCSNVPQISWGPLSPGSEPSSRTRRRRIAAIMGGNLVGRTE